jgi:hypothetical protein
MRDRYGSLVPNKIGRDDLAGADRDNPDAVRRPHRDPQATVAERPDPAGANRGTERGETPDRPRSDRRIPRMCVSYFSSSSAVPGVPAAVQRATRNWQVVAVVFAIPISTMRAPTAAAPKRLITGRAVVPPFVVTQAAE